MMKVTVALSALLIMGPPPVPAAQPRFEKVSDHFYNFASKDGSNIGAVVTEDGVLLINPPPEPEWSTVSAALKRVASKPVRWVIATDYRFVLSGDLSNWVEQGATVLGSNHLWTLASTAGAARAESPPAAKAEGNSAKPKDPSGGKLPLIRLSFERQMYLFPGGIEVRILALQHPAHTAADLVVLLPGERVVHVGDLLAPGRYPDIDDTPGGGNAVEWIEGLKQVIEAVPLLKAAIPQPKSDAGKTATVAKAPAVEKTLEETVVVIPGHGPLSDLREMKGQLEASHKFCGEMAKLVSSKASREKILSAPALAPFRTYENSESFATHLFEALSDK